MNLSKILSFNSLSNNQKHLSRSIKNITGFRPNNIVLYENALKHGSKKDKVFKTDELERLEFLGDSILGAVAAEYVFAKFPNKQEGFLTKLRSRVVNRKQFNRFANSLGISELVQSDLSVNEIQKSNVSGNVFEAFIGAFYLDQGYDKTKAFVLKRVFSILIDLIELSETDTDFKSQLFEYCQKRKFSLTYGSHDAGKSRDKKKLHLIWIEIEQQRVGEITRHSKRVGEQELSELVLTKCLNGEIKLT